jgi:hypothetical protein
LSEFKDENMMDAYNIAICLAPTLIPVPEDKKDQVNHQTDTIELIKLIIQHNEEIFNMECDGAIYEKFERLDPFEPFLTRAEHYLYTQNYIGLKFDTRTGQVVYTVELILIIL